MPEAHLESNSGVMESFPGAFPALSLTRVSKTSVEDVERERVCHMLIRIKVYVLSESVKYVSQCGLILGCRLGPLKSTALHCTKEPFAMQSHYVMDGSLLTFLRIAPVECRSTAVTP